MVTTIQINESVKSELDKLKLNKETYEQIILNLLDIAQECNRKDETLLIEGCREMYDDMIKICKEWESVDSDLDWEWNEDGN
jgi:hypothetical protein